MSDRQARVLVVDTPERALSRALAEGLAGHEVEVARDAFDAIYRIDCSGPPYDAIFCDLAQGDLPGPELWAYLSLNRAPAAERMVFIASAPLRPETRTFLRCVPNHCVDLPVDADAIHALAVRRASHAVDRKPEAASA